MNLKKKWMKTVVTSSLTAVLAVGVMAFLLPRLLQIQHIRLSQRTKLQAQTA